MGADHGRLFAGMGRGGDDDRALADDLFQTTQNRIVRRRRRQVELEISGGTDTRCAKLRIALRVGCGLRQA